MCVGSSGLRPIPKSPTLVARCWRQEFGLHVAFLGRLRLSCFGTQGAELVVFSNPVAFSLLVFAPWSGLDCYRLTLVEVI